MSAPLVGVLALQGDVREHLLALESVGARVRPVRRPGELTGLDGLVLPGGESTTMSMLLESSGLWPPLRAAVKRSMPMLGTCAGMILLAGRVSDGRPDQRSLGAIDIGVKRNGFGRQAQSFECDLYLDAQAAGGSGALDAAASRFVDPETEAGEAATVRAVFIRAPLVEEVGPDVEVLARLPEGHGANSGAPVLCRQGVVLVSSFHPELTGDTTVHQMLMASAGAGSR